MNEDFNKKLYGLGFEEASATIALKLSASGKTESIIP
jgi:hypothetical protein